MRAASRHATCTNRERTARRVAEGGPQCRCRRQGSSTGPLAAPAAASSRRRSSRRDAPAISLCLTGQKTNASRGEVRYARGAAPIHLGQLYALSRRGELECSEPAALDIQDLTRVIGVARHIGSVSDDLRLLLPLLGRGALDHSRPRVSVGPARPRRHIGSASPSRRHRLLP